MYKNFQNIQATKQDNGMIVLNIPLNRVIDYEWKECYQSAICQKGIYTSMRSSGAPTIDKVSFSGVFITTRPFPNNELTKSETKDFLIELDEVVEIANSLYTSHQKQKEERERLKEEEKRKKEKEEKELEDFFNN